MIERARKGHVVAFGSGEEVFLFAVFISGSTGRAIKKTPQSICGVFFYEKQGTVGFSLNQQVMKLRVPCSPSGLHRAGRWQK